MKKSKSSKSNWEIELNNALDDEWKDHFGHNVSFDAKSYFSAIDDLGCGETEITIDDDYTATIKLPPDMSEYRDNVLIFILTNSPLPSTCRYNKKKDTLTLEWHY